MQKITLTQTYYGDRAQYIKQNIEVIRNDDRVSEHIISNDDSSQVVVLDGLARSCPKVKIYNNDPRLHLFRNNYATIERSTNPWVILIDSDNVIDTKFIDTCYAQAPWNDSIIYTPGLAGRFDYRDTGFREINKSNIAAYVDMITGNRGVNDVLNLLNVFVNRDRYCAACRSEYLLENAAPYGLKSLLYGYDSIFSNFLMLKSGMTIKIIPELQYDHTVHDGSFYLSVADECTKQWHEVMALVRTLGG